ncbi:MAG: hypothetical protein H0X73_11630 [Chthoniobacterales bacterium]|nr:hypothetical protein [Chthoniobacterales bacterium]
MIAYTLGTWEDPAVNDHRAEFIKIAAQAAETLYDFGGSWTPSDVRGFLCGHIAAAA